MAKPRMAGDKLNEPTKESADAKQALSQSERNKQIREEIGNDPERLAERISGVDREKYDFGGYTDKQINMALQGDSFGDEDYARLTGKPVGGGGDPKPEPDKEVGIPTPTPNPETGGPGKPGSPYEPPRFEIPSIGYNPGTMNQTVVQDNDISTNVTGNNNTVTNNQDNSVSQGGFSQRSKALRDKYVADVSRFVRA